MTMLDTMKEKSFLVLAVLLTLTLLSWLILYAGALEQKTAGTILVCLAFVKVQLVISQFMELNTAQMPVRIAFWLWTIAVCAFCSVMYWH